MSFWSNTSRKPVYSTWGRSGSSEGMISTRPVVERATGDNHNDDKKQILDEYERGLVARDLQSLENIKRAEATRYSANPYVYYGYTGIPMGPYGIYPYYGYPYVERMSHPNNTSEAKQSQEKLTNRRWYRSPFKGYRGQPSEDLLESAL